MGKQLNHENIWKGIDMSTKSIEKDIVLEDPISVKRLAAALEKAEKYPGKQIILQKDCRDISFGEFLELLAELNAWNYGQPKGDYEPAISTTVTEPDYLGI